MTHNLFLVDDHSMLRKGIASYLEERTFWKVSGSYGNSLECLTALKNLNLGNEKTPEIIIVDIQLGKESGFKLVQKIKSDYPEIKIIIYSMFDTLGFIMQAKDVGASGFISKAATDEELVQCLNIVHNGGTYFEEREASIQQELDSIVSILKDHEKIVFEMILQGKTNNEIKDELFLGLHTVENKVSYILNLCNCNTRKQLQEKFM